MIKEEKYQPKNTKREIPSKENWKTMESREDRDWEQDGSPRIGQSYDVDFDAPQGSRLMNTSSVSDIDASRFDGSDFADGNWHATMAKVPDQIDDAVPRKKEDIAWRLALVARHRSTLIERDHDPGFITWESLAEIFKFSSGAALAAICRHKIQ